MNLVFRYLTALFIWVCNLGASAGPVEDMFFEKNACWGRIYSEAHLSAQPQQRVRAIHVWDDHHQRSHFEQIELSDEDAAAIGPSTGRPAKRLRLYVQPINDSRIHATDILCSAQGVRLNCIGQDGVQGNDRPNAVRLTRSKASIQLDMLLSSWPLLTLEDHLTNPDGLARTALKVSESDRVFRLDRLPASACAGVERTFADHLSSSANPPLSKRMEDARQSSSRNQGRLCLTGQTTSMQLRLSFDAQAGDRAFPIDEMSWRVEQRRIGAPGQLAQSTLSCQVRDYAWRCESRQFDDQARHASIEFVEHTGMLMRRPGGAILRGFACLGGRCSTSPMTSANEDIALTWAQPGACAASN